MNFRKTTVSCTGANRIDLVEYLATLGYQPKKIRGYDHWYLSPLREEKTPSFKVNRKLNAWYDHGIGQGGTLIDFGVLYFNCSVSELLRQLESGTPVQAHHFSDAEHEIEAPKIVLLQHHPLAAAELLQYLRERRISLEIALQYCEEVAYSFGSKTYLAIGFGNDLGGWEIRNRFFKGSSSPKGVTRIKNGSEYLLVFEGFFDLLSYLTMTAKMDVPMQDFLVLNGLAFAPKLCEYLQCYKSIRLFLDNDPAGRKCIAELLVLGRHLKDEGSSYSSHKDLNAFLVSSYEGKGNLKNG